MGACEGALLLARFYLISDIVSYTSIRLMLAKVFKHSLFPSFILPKSVA